MKNITKDIRSKPMGDEWAQKGKDAAMKKFPGLDVGELAEPDDPMRDEYITVRNTENLMTFNDDDMLKPNKTPGFLH